MVGLQIGLHVEVHHNEIEQNAAATIIKQPIIYNTNNNNEKPPPIPTPKPTQKKQENKPPPPPTLKQTQAPKKDPSPPAKQQDQHPTGQTHQDVKSHHLPLLLVTKDRLDYLENTLNSLLQTVRPTAKQSIESTEGDNLVNGKPPIWDTIVIAQDGVDDNVRKTERVTTCGVK